MENFSLIKKLQILMNIIINSPLFLFCCMIGISLLIFYVLNIKKGKVVNKWIFIFAWIFLLNILIINYNSVMLNLIDNLFDEVFTALYFPNLTIYIIILFISNASFFYTIFNKKIDRKNKIINYIETLMINSFLVLIIDIVQKNNINVYEQLTIYSNSNLLVLLELTSAVFTSWILINLLLVSYKKLKKYDVDEFENLPEIVFDDL